MAAVGIGKFILKRFKGREIEIFTGLESEYIELDQFSTFNRFIVIGTVVDYDEESGILEFKDRDGITFFVNEFKVDMFWEADSGFELLKSMRPMIRTGKDFAKKNRDIM